MDRVLNNAPTIIVLTLATIFFQALGPYTFSQYFGTFTLKSLYTLFYLVGYSWLILLIIPLLINHFVFKSTLQDLGLAWPKHPRVTILLTVLSLVILIPPILHFITLSEFRDRYNLVGMSEGKFFIVQFIVLPLYYFAEEFFFRGFFFVGLLKRVGWHAFWITAIFFAYFHMWKPWLEILLAIPVSVILNLLTLYCRSILPAMAVHACMGMVLNIAIHYGF